MKIRLGKIAHKIRKKKIPRKIVLLIFGLLIIIFVATRGGAVESEIKTVNVQEKNLELQVVASGQIESEEEADLRFSTQGKLAYLTVKEGDYVRRGQLIASLDTKDLQKRLERDLNLYFKTRLDFEDVKDSQKDKVITDTLKRIAQRSQADLDNTVIDVELRDLAIEFSNIFSPIEGYITKRGNFFAGNFVFPQDTIATVANTNKLQFVAEVDEAEIGRITTGQNAIVVLDAFPNQSFEVKVAKIAPQALTTSTGATAFEVKFNLDPPMDLRLGMNGEAKIITQRAENVLAIPQEAIVDDRFVWVKIQKQYQNREIIKGFESDLDLEVKSGLEKGEEVVVAGFDKLSKKNLFQKILGRLR